MPPLSELVFRRRPRTARAASAVRPRRRNRMPALGLAEQLEPRAMLAVTFGRDINDAGWAGAFVGAGDTPGTAYVNAVAADAAGNRYVGGSFSGTVDFNPGSAVESRSTVAHQAGFVAKFDGNGKFLTVITFDPAPPSGDDPPGSSSVDALAISTGGKIAAVGHFDGTVDFDPSDATQNRKIGRAHV